MVCASVRSDFTSSSLITWLQGLSCSFSPTSACVPPTRVFSRGYQNTQGPVRQEEAKAMIEASGLHRQAGAGVAIGMQKPIRQQLV